MDLKALFEKHAAVFAQRHVLLQPQDFSHIWNSLTTDEIAALEMGLQTGRWQYRGKLIHSERDAEREAARAAANFSNASAVIAVSVGAGFILGHFGAAVRHVLLIEPGYYCAAALIISGAFLRFAGKITLFVDDLAKSDALEEILPWLQGKNLKQTLIYCHPPLLAADKPLYTRAYERVVALFEKRSVNQATVVKFQQLWNKNIFLNQRIIAQSGTLNQLLAESPPRTIVLAGAGPSLTASLPLLRSERSRFILMAADTAVIPLNKAGIYPDFAFAADPQWLNHFFVQSSAAHRSVWVMDPVVCPAIPHFLSRQGARMLFWNNAFLADTMLRAAGRGDVAHGGSVSTNAFDVALRWLNRRSEAEEPGRLILVGQDLSFSNKQAHCAGAALEARIFAHCHRLSAMENHNLKQMKAMPVLLEKGIGEAQVRTNGKLKIFLDWFSSKAADHGAGRTELINATAAGAQIRGFRHMPLAEALSDLPAEPGIGVKAAGISPAANTEKINHLLANLGELKRIANDSARLAREKNPATAVLERLNANDAAIKKLGTAKDIAGLNAQAIILKITEQGDEVDAAEFYRAMARAAREVKHWAGKSH